MFRELKVLLGITGGIAACKAPLAIRALRARGHDVRCVLSRSAESFVTPLTLEVLTGHAVHGASPVASTGRGEEAHIEAASWADVFCVAPATANTMAKLAAGIADDFLTTALLAFDGPVLIAPAMHSKMWEKNSTRRVCKVLASDGMQLIGPVVGPLASGEIGMGRMVDVQHLVSAIESIYSSKRLRGKRAMVTAGPTYESVDPIRFLGNRSSGKMGFAIATALQRAGVDVTLVAGPVALATPWGVERCDVETAAEMKEAVQSRAGFCDLVVMSAAVADFRPTESSSEKIKKSEGMTAIPLTRTTDILASLRDWAPEALLVGFAAETSDLEIGARAKLESKRVDFVVANDVSRIDIGMQSDENEVTVYSRIEDPVFIARKSKEDLAEDLVDLIADAFEGRV